jgi:hypothetical protein
MHERTILWRFLGIIERVLRLVVSVYSIMFTLKNSFIPLFAGGGGGQNPLAEVTVNSGIARRKTLKTFVPIPSKTSASD